MLNLSLRGCRGSQPSAKRCINAFKFEICNALIPCLRTVIMPVPGIFHFEPAALVSSHFCEKLELCDCTSVIVMFIGAVIVPGVRQSGETLSYINTKLCGISLSIYAVKITEIMMFHLCIIEIISAVLNDRLFLLVMICRSV